jgi:hypothetical protein
LLVGFGVVYAYGGNNPAVMGHSSGEVEGAITSWADISDKPSSARLFVCPRSFTCEDGTNIDGEWASYGCVGQVSNKSTCINTWWGHGGPIHHCTNSCDLIGNVFFE